VVEITLMLRREEGVMVQQFWLLLAGVKKIL
jgi:hypothetical protein